MFYKTCLVVVMVFKCSSSNFIISPLHIQTFGIKNYEWWNALTTGIHTGNHSDLFFISSGSVPYFFCPRLATTHGA